MTATETPPALSVVVPFFNESAVAHAVTTELCSHLATLPLAWEVLLVDDGSTDGTDAELVRAQAAWPQCRIIRLSRNRGQGAALWFGFREARAAVLAMMDGDGQSVPADIGALLPLLDQHAADMVVGVRVGRRDSRARRVASRLANAVRGRLLRDQMSDAGCALKVFRREVLGSFLAVPMLNPFMPAFAVAGGFRVIERPVAHRPRTTGRSNFALHTLLWRPTFDLLCIWWLLRRRIPVVRAVEAREASQSAPLGRAREG